MVSAHRQHLFKPAANMTTYFTYAKRAAGRRSGRPGHSVPNAGVSLPPYRSKEYELGYKADGRANIDLTAALFRSSGRSPSRSTTIYSAIKRPERNRGLENVGNRRGCRWLDALWRRCKLLNARLDTHRC